MSHIFWVGRHLYSCRGAWVGNNITSPKREGRFTLALLEHREWIHDVELSGRRGAGVDFLFDVVVVLGRFSPKVPSKRTWSDSLVSVHSWGGGGWIKRRDVSDLEKVKQYLFLI